MPVTFVCYAISANGFDRYVVDVLDWFMVGEKHVCVVFPCLGFSLMKDLVAEPPVVMSVDKIKCLAWQSLCAVAGRSISLGILFFCTSFSLSLSLPYMSVSATSMALSNVLSHSSPRPNPHRSEAREHLLQQRCVRELFAVGTLWPRAAHRLWQRHLPG